MKHAVCVTGLGCMLLVSDAVCDPCPPAAAITGDPDVVRAIETVLQARGVDIGSPTTDAAFAAACPRVAAEVRIAPTGWLEVSVTDGDGRQTRRIAEDIAAAATVIESWARRDLLDPLIAPRGVLAVMSFEAATLASATVPRESRSQFSLSGGAEAGMSNDGALWTGLRVRGCVSVSTICIGGTLQLGIDTQARGASKTLETARTAMALTVTAERPLRHGSVVLSPGIGVGLRSVSATYTPEDEYEQASTIHARGGLAATVVLTRRWALRVDLDAELAPFARERLGENDGVDHQLAASPLVQTWLGLALAYGAP